MSSWFVMPCGLHADRAAAFTELRDTLGAMRWSATLIALGSGTERDRGLGLALLEMLARADRALDRLEKTGLTTGRCSPTG